MLNSCQYKLILLIYILLLKPLYMYIYIYNEYSLYQSKLIYTSYLHTYLCKPLWISPEMYIHKHIKMNNACRYMYVLSVSSHLFMTSLQIASDIVTQFSPSHQPM